MNTLTVTLPTWFLWAIVGALGISTILHVINISLKLYEQGLLGRRQAALIIWKHIRNCESLMLRYNPSDEKQRPMYEAAYLEKGALEAVLVEITKKGADHV